MIQILRKEMQTLKAFQHGQQQSGQGDWHVDALACRGLLHRIGKVDRPLPNEGYAIRREVMTARAQKHVYRITRRGLWALAHATIIEAWPLAA